MSRFSRLPVRTSQLLEPGSSLRDTRLSRNENRRTRPASTSRSSNSMASCTPSLRRSKSSISLKRTPQSVQGSRTRSVDRQRIKKKDDRPIQDKKWQAEMLRKTQEYFQNDPDGFSILNQGKNLRPITNNMFVQLVNIVFKNIDERLGELTTTNYVELLPQILTKLMYPGNVTSSMMKTANTMHTWPHILAILSWLVELHHRMKMCDVFIKDNMYILPTNMSEKELRDMKILQLESQTLVAAFIRWNKGEETDVVFHNFSQELKEICKCEYETVHHLKDTVEKLTYQKTCDERAINAQREEIEKEEKEHEKLVKNCRYAEETLNEQKEYLRKLKTKIANQEEQNQKLRETDEKYTKENAELEEKITKQTMNAQERENLLRVIEELKAKKDSTLKRREATQRISDEIDIRMSHIKLEMEEKVSAYNIALFRASLKHPELKDYAIKTDSWLASDVYQTLLEKTKKAKDYHIELETVLNNEQTALAIVREQHAQQQNKVQKLISENNALQLRIDDIKHKSLEASEHEYKEIQRLNEIISKLNNKISNLKQRFPNLKEIKENMREEAKEHEILKAQLKNSDIAMLETFENLEKEVVNNIIPEYRDIRRVLSERMLEQLKVHQKP